MKIYTWDQIMWKLIKRPTQFIAFIKLPRNYATFEEWLNVDKKKCDIVAVAISCKCALSLRQQQTEMMAYRQKICRTPKEWLKYFSSDRMFTIPIDKIIQRYAQQRKCHRNYEGDKAGIRCYCDEHNH